MTNPPPKLNAPTLSAVQIMGSTDPGAMTKRARTLSFFGTTRCCARKISSSATPQNKRARTKSGPRSRQLTKPTIPQRKNLITWTRSWRTRAIAGRPRSIPARSAINGMTAPAPSAAPRSRPGGDQSAHRLTINNSDSSRTVQVNADKRPESSR